MVSKGKDESAAVDEDGERGKKTRQTRVWNQRASLLYVVNPRNAEGNEWWHNVLHGGCERYAVNNQQRPGLSIPDMEIELCDSRLWMTRWRNRCETSIDLSMV